MRCDQHILCGDRGLVYEKLFLSGRYPGQSYPLVGCISKYQLVNLLIEKQIRLTKSDISSVTCVSIHRPFTCKISMPQSDQEKETVLVRVVTRALSGLVTSFTKSHS
jgi:hypothetical protein